MLTVGSLFSGIGGFDLGFEQSGMSVKWQCEIDKAASTVLARHWPDVPNMGDVRNVGYGTQSVDVICGGFPCQDVSVAGRRAGLAGKRSGLWHEFHRVLVEIRPQWAIIENVPGLLSSNGGRDFTTILQALVKCGYGVAWRILDAQYFGVPQRRRRVFIVGSLGDGRAAQVLFEREGGTGDTPPRRTSGAGVARALAASSVSSGYRYDPNGEEYVIAHTLRAEGHDASEDGTGRGVPLVTGLQMNFIRRPRIGDYIGSLSAQPGDAQFNGLWDMRYGVRRLTPRECERLQGFPDDWTTWGVDNAYLLDRKAGRVLDPQRYLAAIDEGARRAIADSARYRMLGNAVAVPVAAWIAKQIVILGN